MQFLLNLIEMSGIKLNHLFIINSDIMFLNCNVFFCSHFMQDCFNVVKMCFKIFNSIIND